MNEDARAPVHGDLKSQDRLQREVRSIQRRTRRAVRRARRAVMAAAVTLLLATAVLGAVAWSSFDGGWLLWGTPDGSSAEPGTVLLALIGLALLMAVPFVAARAGGQQHWLRAGLCALLSAVPAALLGSLLALLRQEGTPVVTSVLVLGTVLAVAMPPAAPGHRWRRGGAVIVATGATFALAGTDLVLFGPLVALVALLLVA